MPRKHAQTPLSVIIKMKPDLIMHSTFPEWSTITGSYSFHVISATNVIIVNNTLCMDPTIGNLKRHDSHEGTHI
jgi:hypothetical protein